jgi:hypothetical protein
MVDFKDLLLAEVSSAKVPKENSAVLAIGDSTDLLFGYFLKSGHHAFLNVETSEFETNIPWATPGNIMATFEDYRENFDSSLKPNSAAWQSASAASIE